MSSYFATSFQMICIYGGQQTIVKTKLCMFNLPSKNCILSLVKLFFKINQVLILKFQNQTAWLLDRHIYLNKKVLNYHFTPVLDISLYCTPRVMLHFAKGFFCRDFVFVFTKTNVRRSLFVARHKKVGLLRMLTNRPSMRTFIKLFQLYVATGKCQIH